jgi:hypothetical protein
LLLADWGRCLLFSRLCRDNNLSREEQIARKYEYYLLVRGPERDPSSGELAITGADLEDARVNEGDPQHPVITFHWNKQGADRFYHLTSTNLPTRLFDEQLARHIAVILDGQILVAPSVQTAIRADVAMMGVSRQPRRTGWSPFSEPGRCRPACGRCLLVRPLFNHNASDNDGVPEWLPVGGASLAR